MTLIQAVNEADNLKPNMYGLPEKIKWLSRLDQRIFEEVLLTHELSDEEKEPFMVEIDGKRIFSFCAYNENDQDKELIVKEPYDEIYVHWLCAQIDLYNREFTGFNASNAIFESTYLAFRDAFNRTHMPKGRRKNYF